MIYGHVGRKFNVLFDMSQIVLSFRNYSLQLNIKIKNYLFVKLGYTVIILVLVIILVIPKNCPL